MGTKTVDQKDTQVVKRKTAWLLLTEEEWRQIHLLALMMEPPTTAQELLTAWVRAGLGQVQWLRVSPQR